MRRALLGLCAIYTACAQPTVQTADGPVVGSFLGAGATATRSFRGIPYAAPPINDLRWRAPQPAAPWTEPRNATAFGRDCPQLGPAWLSLGYAPVYAAAEDCLFLNVYTPLPDPAEAPAPDAAEWPVMVYFHAGSITWGAGNDDENNAPPGASLAAANNVALVTFNYRLGALGFLASEQLKERDAEGSTGFYGLQVTSCFLFCWCSCRCSCCCCSCRCACRCCCSC